MCMLERRILIIPMSGFNLDTVSSKDAWEGMMNLAVSCVRGGDPGMRIPRGSSLVSRVGTVSRIGVTVYCSNPV